MPELRIQITEKAASAVGNPHIVCGNSDYTVSFTFDSEWDACTAKTARFSYLRSGQRVCADVLFEGDSVSVPVLSNTDEVEIGVYAGDLHTSTPARIPCARCITDGSPVTVPMDKYAYAYFEWKDGNQSVKLYQPFSQTMKWLSKHDSSVWDLWKQAFMWAQKKSDECVIITSSRKDAMCLWENLGVPAMSLQGEGYLPKPQVMRQVLERFRTVYLWYDNDFKHKDENPGQDNARKLIELYPDLKNVCIPSEYRCKDPSDLVKEWGKEMLIEVWKRQRIQ